MRCAGNDLKEAGVGNPAAAFPRAVEQVDDLRHYLIRQGRPGGGSGLKYGLRNPWHPA